MTDRLGHDFFDRDVHVVARELLGATISHGGVTIRITEVEAYGGVGDPGAHAYKGMTPSNRTLFAQPGSLYVYFTYGMHHCANLVASQSHPGCAVLLRAGEVVAGLDIARERRTREGSVSPTDRDLARGPGRLAQALGLTRADDGLLTTDTDCAVRVSARESGSEVGGIEVIDRRIETGPRVGVSGPGGDAETYPWRYWLAGEPTVSPYKRATGRWRHAPRNPMATAPRGEAGLAPGDTPSPTKRREPRS